jgi:prepilin-type N-terminal cleavage/methylation domain-containing protein
MKRKAFTIVELMVAIAILLILCGLVLNAVEVSKKATLAENATPQALFDAIREVETGGEPDGGIGAVGDRGKSIGPYQIGELYWTDAVEHRPSIGGEWQDCAESYHYSEQIMLAYWDRWGAETNEEKARMHNGGPGGMQKDVTLEYWNRVKARLD